MENKNKSGKSIIQLLGKFQSLVKNKPTLEKMYEEIRMMKFKIKPVQGDISNISLNNDHFIETLWSMGKLDEFYQQEFHKLSPRGRETFIKIFDELHIKFQGELNKVNLINSKSSKKPEIFEMEIYKEKIKKVN